MLSALQMLFSPFKAWEKVVAANRHWVFLLLTMVLPIIGITAAVEAAGLLNLRHRHTEVGTVQFSKERVQKYEVVYVAASLAIILLGTVFLQSVAASFDVTATYSQCFAVLAYTYSPIMFLHMLDALPGINTWICYGIGLALSFQVLYHGVGLCLRPEQTKGFGLLLFSALFVTVLSGLAHFAAVMVLEGKLWRQPIDASWLIR